MRLTRICVDEPLEGRSTITLRGAAARHAGRVLRLKTGDPLRVFDGSGGEYAATVRNVGRDTVEVTLGDFVAEGPAPPLEIVLWQGVARGDRMDFTVQKATELGVDAILPVITRRSVAQLSAERAGRRLRHWRALAASAAEQSGRTRLPELFEPAPLATCLATPARPGLRIVLDPDASHSLASLSGERIGRLTLLAGPEGGLDDAERDAAVTAGFRPFHIGPRVLRTETAAIAALSIAQALWGDLR
jgi:16S rRNA (uracil1498-N3)-methyltransferase